MNKPITFKDFISQVENLLKDGRVDTSGKIPENANNNFSFKDLEVGKLYVSFHPFPAGKIWFIYPIELNSQNDYTLYSCFVDEGDDKINIDIPRGANRRSWKTKVWNNKFWQVLDDKSSFQTR